MTLVAHLTIVLTIALVGGVTGAMPVSAQPAWQGVERIVAVGDVHGDYERFTEVLRTAGVIDDDDHWVGGETHLVQTGDAIDRGPDTQRVLDLLMRLEEEASDAGGMVHALLGNHETMNILGDLRYVAPEDYESFRSPDSGRLRNLLFERHVELLRARAAPDAPPVEVDDAYRERWESTRPLGYVERLYAFGPDGKYGRWLRQHDTIVQVNDTLFLHGGISPAYVDVPLDQINDRVRQELDDDTLLSGGMIQDQAGPLWYRGLSTDEEALLAPHVDAVLARHAARRIVVGHSVQPAIMPRLDGRIVLIDVGLSGAYGGPPACLLIEGGRAFALHRGEKIALPEADGEPVVAYLRRAAALDPAPSPLLPLIEKLESQLTPATVP